MMMIACHSRRHLRCCVYCRRVAKVKILTKPGQAMVQFSLPVYAESALSHLAGAKLAGQQLTIRASVHMDIAMGTKVRPVHPPTVAGLSSDPCPLPQEDTAGLSRDYTDTSGTTKHRWDRSTVHGSVRSLSEEAVAQVHRILAQRRESHVARVRAVGHAAPFQHPAGDERTLHLTQPPRSVACNVRLPCKRAARMPGPAPRGTQQTRGA
jgi:hypothetical protein